MGEEGREREDEYGEAVGARVERGAGLVGQARMACGVWKG